MLRILFADDQIPPEDLTGEEYREQLVQQFGRKQQTLHFADQCRFVAEVIGALRDAGYLVTEARTFGEARRLAQESEFDLAIIDLGWFLDPQLGSKEQPAAGWSLCQFIDDRDALYGRHTPQIIFSSRFPTEPDLSREAARRQKLPIFKEPTPSARNSLLAAVAFVEATLTRGRGIADDADQSTERGPAIPLSMPPVAGRSQAGKKSIDVFVLMPFEKKQAPVYTECLRPLAQELGLEIHRADDEFSTEPFMNKVWNGICSARLIIADCTDRNPNVFYEIGIAHTVGKKVALICRSKTDIPADLLSFDFIEYSAEEGGTTRLADRLRKLIPTVLKIDQPARC